MSYTTNRTFNGEAFEDVHASTRTALGENGHGNLTQLDVKATEKTQQATC